MRIIYVYYIPMYIPIPILYQTRASEENFPGEGGNGKRPKISKTYRKIALFSLFRGRGEATENRPKNSKKSRKTALLSLYLLYLHHV